MITRRFLLAVSLLLFFAMGRGQEEEGKERLRTGPALAMSEARAGHTATLLPDGRVLIAGGFQPSRRSHESAYLATAELFDPRTRRFTTTGSMNFPRAGHAAALLPNGFVLVAGGFSTMGTLSSAEIFDPAAGTFTPIGNMHARRGGLTATPLPDGSVLLAGGGDKEPGATAEIFDPTTKKFRATASMIFPRSEHSAVSLPDGLVLITGGASRRETVLADAEIFDPRQEQFLRTGTMATPRYKHASRVLQNGDVLVFGGSSSSVSSSPLASVERYDAASGRFLPMQPLRHSHAKLAGAVAAIPGDLYLIAGGDAAIELYAGGEQRSVVLGTLDRPYAYTTATILKGDSVLIAGGCDDSFRSIRTAWIWKKSPP